MCDADRRVRLDDMFREGRNPHNSNSVIENDAIDRDGNPILFAYLPDMPRLARFVAGVKIHDRAGTIVCFDFQKDVLSRYCGEWVEFEVIIFEKFMKVFYPPTESAANHT